MTTPTPMTREELLELAPMDALGLLDEYEAALFTRSFHHAPVGVQEEIKDLQAAVAADATLLPDVQPGPQLAASIRRRVAEAVEAESARLAPLATIGRERTNARGNAARSGIAPYRHFWRAASFVLASGTIALAFLLAESLNQSNMIAKLALSNAISAELEAEIGPFGIQLLCAANATHIALDPVPGSGPVKGFVVVDEAEILVYLADLPTPGGSYEVAIVNASGVPQVVGSAVAPPAAKLSLRVAVDPAMLKSAVSWQIIDATTKDVVLVGQA